MGEGVVSCRLNRVCIKVWQQGCQLSWLSCFKIGLKYTTQKKSRNMLISWSLYPQFFLELITTQLRFYMVSPQLSLLIMIFIERYPLKRCQGCVKLIASKVNCFLNITDLSEVQLCMSSNSWTWECPHTKDAADHVPLIFLSSVLLSSFGYTISSWMKWWLWEELLMTARAR